jgi:hypothetical protein
MSNLIVGLSEGKEVFLLSSCRKEMESRKKHEAKEYSSGKMMIRATKIEYESYGQASSWCLNIMKDELVAHSSEIFLANAHFFLFRHVLKSSVALGFFHKSCAAI